MLVQPNKEPKQMVLTAEEAEEVLRKRRLLDKQNEDDISVSSKDNAAGSGPKLRVLYS